jgi:hypothetical protein
VQIFSTFDQSTYLEMAIAKLEEKGIRKDQILAVPLDNRPEERKLFDTIHRADGVSLFDTGAALGTALSVIGASVGFTLKWGPIYWGLIGAGTGFLIGFLINLFYYNVFKKMKQKIKGRAAEVIVVIECNREQGEMVEAILWDHLAFGVAKLS